MQKEPVHAGGSDHGRSFCDEVGEAKRIVMAQKKSGVIWKAQKLLGAGDVHLGELFLKRLDMDHGELIWGWMGEMNCCQRKEGTFRLDHNDRGGLGLNHRETRGGWMGHHFQQK